jgi:hypothetical protein
MAMQPDVEEELLSLLEHLGSVPIFSGFRISLINLRVVELAMEYWSSIHAIG